jgi:hypothetical protein
MRCRSTALLALMLALGGGLADAGADVDVPDRPDAPDELDARLAARAATLAKRHYDAGEYYRAIGSYEELALFATDDAIRRYAAIRIAMSYHHGKQFGDAAKHYDIALSLPLDADLAQALRIQRALARAERVLDEPGGDALDAIAAELAPSVDDGAHRELALYSLARIQALGGRTSDARQTAARIDGPSAAVLQRALASPAPSRRSPWLGLTLSTVVPGAGSVYGGHLVDGLYYFGLTTLSGLGAWEVYDGSRAWTDQKVTFYALGSLAVVFYAANLVQGYISVARRNESARLAHRRALWRATARPLPLESYPLDSAAR